MLYEITGRDDLALIELETAPYDTDDGADSLVNLDSKFYRIYFCVKRNMPISQFEIDAFPVDYETYLPADGRVRGVLVKKSEVHIRSA